MSSSQEQADPAGAPRPEETVSRLFDEWLTARERGDETDIADLLERAGSDAKALRQRIHLYDALEELGDGEGPPREDEGRRLGRFQLLGTLGSGGIGTVHHALDPELKREVALKVLNPGTGDGGGWLLNEARSLARIHHSGVVRVYEVQRSGPAYLVVMEHLAGPALDLVIHELRELKRSLHETGDVEPEGATSMARETAERLEPISARVRILYHLAEALAHCHDREVLHRDVKPGNVVFDEKGLPRLIDFGLAHKGGPRNADEALAITESLVASPAYMAPEQVESERTGADPRTDQFSFGVLAYELLTLRHPFSGDGRVKTMDAIARAEPQRPRALVTTLPDDLERIVLHALERDPRDRYPSMGALAADLLAVMERRPISLRRPGQWARVRRFVRQHQRGVRAVGLSLLVAVATGLAFKFQRVVEARQRIDTELERLQDEFDTAEGPNAFVELASDLLALRTRLARQAGTDEQERRLTSLEERLGRDVTAGAWSAEQQYEQTSAGYSTGHRNIEELVLLDWLRLVQTLGRSFPDVALDPALARISTLDVSAPGLEDVSLHSFQVVPPASIHPMFAMASSLVPSELPRRPFPGRYRFLAVDEATGRVVTDAGLQLYDVWRPARALELQAPDPELLARAQPMQRMRVLPQLGFPHHPSETVPPGTPSLLLPAIRILPEHVTRDEFERFARDQGFEPAMADAYPDEHLGTDAAWVSPQEAILFATAHGARLPTLLELSVAEKEELLSLDVTWYPDERKLPNRVWQGREQESVIACGEWVEDVGKSSNPRSAQLLHLVLDFVDDVGARNSYPFTAIHGMEVQGPWINTFDKQKDEETGLLPTIRSGIAFRLVFADDTLDAYLANSRREEPRSRPEDARPVDTDTPSRREE